MKSLSWTTLALLASSALGGTLWLHRSQPAHHLVYGPPLDQSGQYAPAADGFNGIDDGIRGIPIAPAGQPIPSGMTAWATQVIRYQPAPGVAPDWQDPHKALGPVSGDPSDIVSLGDLDQSQIPQGQAPGEITLGFEQGIGNGQGADFVVFENGFMKQNGVFGELAYVEVSSDGIHFARFASESQTQKPVLPGDPLDATGIYNLAGKHSNNLYRNEQGTLEGQSVGTPFDLETLRYHPLVLTGRVDLNAIRMVRIIDIPGNGAFKDSLGNPIYDPWPTTDTAAGGFDLEAIGVMHTATEPESLASR